MELVFFILKIISSILFFVFSFVFIYLCFKAEDIKEKSARIEKLIRKDIQRIYQQGSIATKLIIELVLSKYSFDLGKYFIK